MYFTSVVGGTEMLDKTICTLVAKEPDMDKIVEEFHEVLDLACRSSFKFHGLQRQHRHISQSPGGQKNL